MYQENAKELAQLQSLMERMDMHCTKSQAEKLVESKFGKLINEENRNITNDKLSDYVGKIKNGWSVHIGYVTTVPLSLSKTYPTQQSHDELSQVLSKGTGPKFNDYFGSSLEDMQSFITDPGKRKTFSFPTKDNYEVIKYQEYSMNWMDSESIAKFYSALGEQELQLRKQYGFGADGAENTWRNKSSVIKTGQNAGKLRYAYGGSGLMPIVNKGGNTFTDSNANGGFHNSYQDIETGKYAIRQKAVAYGEPRYFLHDLSDDTYEEVSKEIIFTLSNKFKRPSVVKELEAEEKEFVDALSAITKEKNRILNLLEDKCLFISYTIVMPDGEKKPKRLVNQELKTQLTPILDDLGLSGRLSNI